MCEAKQYIIFARSNIKSCYNPSRFLLCIKQHELGSKLWMFTVCLQGSVTVRKVKIEPNAARLISFDIFI